jgi:hypothetical protein
MSECLEEDGVLMCDLWSWLVRACVRPWHEKKEVLSLLFRMSIGEGTKSILPTCVIAVSSFGLEETLKCASEINMSVV